MDGVEVVGVALEREIVGLLGFGVALLADGV